MIGRSRLPCHDIVGRVPQRIGLYHRMCPVCHRRWTADVTESPVMTRRCGVRVLRVEWHEHVKAAT
jgi:hypothetical protein